MLWLCFHSSAWGGLQIKLLIACRCDWIRHVRFCTLGRKQQFWCFFHVTLTIFQCKKTNGLTPWSCCILAPQMSVFLPLFTIFRNCWDQGMVGSCCAFVFLVDIFTFPLRSCICRLEKLSGDSIQAVFTLHRSPNHYQYEKTMHLFVANKKHFPSLSIFEETGFGTILRQYLRQIAVFATD